MYRKLLVLTSVLAMVYAGVLEHPAISYVSAPKVTVAHVPSLTLAAAPKIAAPSFSYYAAAAPKIASPSFAYYTAAANKIDYSKFLSAAPALTYAAAAPKISFAAAPAISYAPAVSKVVLPAPKIALHPAPALSYVAAPQKLSFGLSAPAIAFPKYAVAAPVVNYAPAVKVVDAGSFDPNPEYSYSYEVDDAESGDQKSAHESRGKDGTVSGSYSVTEPDGSKRTVEYTADHINGFKATVHREEAKHDAMKMVEKKMKEEAKQMEEAMKKGAVMVMPHPPEMMMVMKADDTHHAVVMKH